MTSFAPNVATDDGDDDEPDPDSGLDKPLCQLAFPCADVTDETIITPHTNPFPADREVVVRKYVERTPTEPVVIQEGGTVRPGSIVPSYVPLQTFGGLTDPFYQGYRYFVSPDHKVVIVDPSTRTVVRILDL